MTDMTAIIKVFMEPGLHTDRLARATLRPGTMLNGRITDILPSGLLQINFGKFRTQTRVRFPVSKGDSLQFEVLETGNQIKLKIQDPPPAPNNAPVDQAFKPEDLQHFRRQLEAAIQKPDALGADRSQADSLRPLIARLNHLLSPLQAGWAPDRLAPVIKALLTNSGIFFEKKLQAVLLQLFKSPEGIDVGRAANHPFVTNIFDTDLKPNLLKLAAALEQTGQVRETKLAPIHTATRNFIKHIETEQTRLIRTAPAGSGKTGTAYPLTHSSTISPGGGWPRHSAANLPTAAVRILQLQLSKTGLWSDPQIRALFHELIQAPGAAGGRYAGPRPAPQPMNNPVSSQLPLDTDTIGKAALLNALTGVLNSTLVAGSKALTPLLSDFRSYIQSNRHRLDSLTEKALNQLEDFNRTPTGRTGSSETGLGRRVLLARQNLRIMSRFIESRPPDDLSRSPSTKVRAANTRSLPAKHAPGETRSMSSDFRGSAQSNGSAKLSPSITGREITRVVNLIGPQATAISDELDRIEKTLVERTANRKVAPGCKKLSKAVRSLQALIERNQIPISENVKRTLASLTAPKSPSTVKSTATPASGPLPENLVADLAVLRDFITFQKTELTETLELLRGLLGRADTENETGDRPGSNRRGADPLQVITFTLPMEAGQKPARLKVFYPLKKSASPGSGFRISLLLSMDRMGPLRADIFAYQQNLEVKFSTTNESARRHIDGHLNSLGNLLKGAFDTLTLTAAIDENNIAAFEYEDLEPSGDRLVDLQA